MVLEFDRSIFAVNLVAVNIIKIRATIPRFCIVRRRRICERSFSDPTAILLFLPIEIIADTAHRLDMIVRQLFAQVVDI